MNRQVLSYQATRYELIEVAKGKKPADLFVRGGRVVNVYSGEILPAHIAVCKDRIAYVGESEAAIGEDTIIVDAENRWVAPGFIEPHAHPWVVYNPISLTEKVLPLGTTTTVHDNLFFYLHLGAEGFQKMVEDLRGMPGLHLWLARLVSQADYIGEREEFSSESVRKLLDLPDVIGTAEVTRWPLLYDAAPFLLETVEYAKSIGKISDGHTSGCSYERLNSIVASGISGCHEAISVQEVKDRLRLGLWTTLRNSSLRPDLPEIVKAVTEHGLPTHRMLMTTDGPHPGFIEKQGFVDGLLRVAVESGIPPVQAIQMVTLNAAQYLGLDEHLGGIAPGRRADLVLLPDLTTFRPDQVVAGGQIVAEKVRLTASMPKVDFLSYPQKKPLVLDDATLLNPDRYRYPVDDRQESVTVPVIQFKIAVITKRRDVSLPVRNGYADISDHPGLIYGALIDRDGQWTSHGILDNFLDEVDGMASTYNTTTNLLVLGRDPVAMGKAASRVRDMGGGIVLMEQGKPILEIPLPFTGMMSTSLSFETAAQIHRSLFQAVRERGYRFQDILYSLLFLTCDSLPGPRITPNGLFDVKSKTVLLPSVHAE